MSLRKNQIKVKIKQLFCKHKNIEYKRRITEYHHLQGDRIYKFCTDCGKLLDSEFCTWEELKLRFEEYR